ncbi:hypothetical protein ACJJIK_12280 [Microbulbifer sp. ZKSA006]|uniref:hypothetical protein n=1 Tax=Microbulbifer sp. ZKSA006 TaxID=3243390 RepID=UPI00403927E6
MSKEKTFSFRKGYTFSFEDEGNVIEAWFSALSGLEKVYVNGELVSSQRNLSTDSTNSFSIGPNEYSTNLSVVSLFKGPFVCTLSKNGSEYKRQKLLFSKSDSSSKRQPFIARFSFFIVLGALLGFARAYWQLPNESIYIFLAALFVAVFAYQIKEHKGAGPVIEDEKIV